MNLRYTTPSGSSVTLNHVRLTGFSAENIYDGDAFNRSGRRETITGTAIISGNPLTSSTGAIDTIRNTLNAPRGKIELEFTSNPGTWYLLVDGRDSATTNIDARNGPLPNVNVSRIEGSHANAVTFVNFTYNYFACSATRIQKFEMHVTQSLDEAGFITMTRSGAIKVSNKPYSGTPRPATVAAPQVFPVNADLNVDTGASPDLYRYLIAGKPDTYFRRTRQDYTLDASLTTLSFTIEDRMVFRELKFPVMMGDASFQYERSLGSAAGMLGTKTFSCHFEGGPDTPPGDLLTVAIEAAAARIDFEKDLVQSITVREPNIYGRNRVELTVVANGQGEGELDPAIVRDMFTDPHTTGGTRYVSAYPNRGAFIQSTTGLRWDACQVPDLITQIYETNPEDAAVESTLTVKETPKDGDIAQSDGEQVTEPLVKDTGLTNTDNRIKHLDGTQEFDTQDTGMLYLEATGGALQWPIQIRTPVVVVTQTVRYISNTQSPAVPYPEIGEPFVVLNERIVVNNAPPDAAGKPVFAVVATRQIQIQTSASPNTRFGEGGVSRRVWAPATVNQSRGLYTSQNTINAQQIDVLGNVRRSDYTSA